MPGLIPPRFEAYQDEFVTALDAWKAVISSELEAAKSEVTLEGGEFNTSITEALTNALVPQLNLQSFGSANQISEFVDGLIAKITSVASDADWTAAEEVIRAATEKVANGIVPTDEEKLAVHGAWADLLGVDGPIYWYLQDLMEAGVLTKSAVDDIMLSLEKGIDPKNIVGKSFDDTTQLMEQQAEASKNAAWGLDQEAASMSAVVG